MTLRDRLQSSKTDRRLLLLLVLLLVFVGSGVGTFLFDSQTPDAGNPTPTPGDTATPVPTPVAGGPPDPTATPTSNDGTPRPSTPTDGTPTEDDDRDDDEQRDGERDDGNDGPTTPSPGLELGDDQSLFSAAGIVPGQSGHGNLTVRNVAGEDGQLTISAIDATDEENGITDAESSADGTAKRGELSKHLEVRFAIHENGNEEYLVGSDAEYVPLANLTSGVSSSEYPLGSGDEVTLVADWRLPPETGNEVQSDGVAVDVGLTLESLGS